MSGGKTCLNQTGALLLLCLFLFLFSSRDCMGKPSPSSLSRPHTAGFFMRSVYRGSSFNLSERDFLLDSIRALRKCACPACLRCSNRPGNFRLCVLLGLRVEVQIKAFQNCLASSCRRGCTASWRGRTLNSMVGRPHRIWAAAETRLIETCAPILQLVASCPLGFAVLRGGADR